MTDNKNLGLWEKVARVPKEHLKGFKRGGGFEGTAIKPMWSFKTMTENFGPCGTGWGMLPPQFTLENGVEGERLVYCTVGVWVGDKASPFYGVGGDKVVGKNKYGLSSDDEAFKKAYTDALTNALKLIGVGADIHMGLWDGNKYVDEKPEPEPVQSEAPARQKYDHSPLVRKAHAEIDRVLNQISQSGTLDDLRVFWGDKATQTKLSDLPADYRTALTEKKDEIKSTLTEKAA